MSTDSPPIALPVHVKRAYVLPTRYGLGFGVVLLLIVAGSLNYGNNMGLLFAFLIAGISVVSAFHTHRNITGITLITGHCPSTFAGSDTVMVLEVDPGGRRRWALQFRRHPDDDHPIDLDRGHQRIEIPMPTQHRGRAPVGPLTVDTRYPLGIFKAWQTIVPDLDCLVWPTPLAGAGGRPLSGDGHDGHHPTPTPGVDDFDGLRPYQPGDSLKHIHWKSFSRGQGLQTKAFTATAGGTRIIDWQDVAGEDVETRLSRMCHAVLTAHAAGHPYGLKLPGTSIAPGTGTAHRNHCLRALAEF